MLLYSSVEIGGCLTEAKSMINSWRMAN
ncbi:DUF3102 domain-containing protein [Desulfosporosinus hippei]|nr:DUF3102 domain-containing protein [Desulfosporosinus hippei]